MSNGLDDGGPGVLCTHPGSESGDSEDDTIDDPITNVFLGRFDTLRLSTPSPVVPTVTLGTNDFSIECWLGQTAGSNYQPSGGEALWSLGFIDISADPRFNDLASFTWSGGLTPIHSGVFNDALFGATENVTIDFTEGAHPAWSHHALNFDRSANLQYFINGTSIGTAVISGASGSDLGTRPFHFLVHETGGQSDAAGAASCPYMLGPLAVHARILTTTEIQNSFRGRTVNSFGAANTHLFYDWKKIRGATAWDTDITHINYTFRFGADDADFASGVIPYPMLAPMGAVGDVLAEDASGNDNHLILQTTATYANTGGAVGTSLRARTAFSMSNFFR